ncbi:MAG TPA: CHAT domain-containing protein, partial [Thermomicrobiales bacterium]|nr:CHAT domain-containing protein [Thermomicrobiales bacterium]
TDESQTNPGLRPPAGALPPLAPPPGPGREGEHLVGAPPNEEADDSPTVFIPRDRNGGSKTRSVSPQPAARPVPWPPYAGGERGEADVAAPPLPPLPPLAVPQFPSPPPPPAARPALSTVTRNTAADFPSRVEPGSENLLQYTISPRALTGHAAQGTLAVAVPADEVTLPLIVSVVASEFDVLDADTGQRRNFQRLTLDLAADAADVTGQFVLRARAVAAPTRSVIHLNFAHRGLPVGEIDLHVEISADPSGAGDRPSGQAGRLDINLDAPPPPDLVLHVNHQPDGKVELWADRTGQYCGRDLGAFPIAGGAEQYAQTILNAFHDAQARRTPALRRLAVAQAGAHLWSQLPRLCRDFYWQELHDRDLSIAIYSDEPYIPWELITPVPDGGGEPAPMLGAAFAIARWKRGVRFPSPLRVRDFAVIAPTYQVNTLQHADAEAQDLIRGYGARRVAGQVEPVTDLLETPGTQAIHFCSHGSFDMAAADNSRIKLEDGPLFPMNIRNVQVGRRDHPMVFLNACGVGGEGWSLTNIGGWGEVFCDAGFSIFVGPYWAVDDAVARIAANLFYARLKAGDTVGQAMRAVRRQFTADLADARACAHPTWIAYTLHSQPNMAVHFGI